MRRGWVEGGAISRVANRIVRVACRGGRSSPRGRSTVIVPAAAPARTAAPQEPFDVADPPPGLGPDQQVRPGPPRRGEEVVEVGLAVGHGEDRLLGGQGGLGGGQGVEPASTLLLGGLLLVALARLPRVAGSRTQVRWSIRPRGTPAAVTARVECSQNPVRLLWAR